MVTDIIVLRKWDRDQAPDHVADWLTTQLLPGQLAQCNGYFLDHPEMVIGHLSQDTHGMYGSQGLTDLGKARRVLTIVLVEEY